jgi:putative inorganic carbon (HCO3(-)) transporter
MDKHKIESIVDKSIEFLLYLMIFFIPISKAAIEITFGLATALFIVKKILNPQFGFIKNAVFFLLLLFFAFCALSLFNSGEYLTKSFRALFGKWLQYITIFILAQDTLNTSRRLKNAVILFIATSALVTVDGLFQKLAGIDFLRQRVLVEGAPITASFENQNSLAAYLVPMVLMAIASAINHGFKKEYRLIFSLLGVLSGSCLILTFSRGAWLGFFIGLVLLLFLSRRLKNILIIICVFIIVLFSFSYSRERIIKSFVKGGSGARFSLAQSALDMVRDKPFLGQGLGTFMSHFREYAYIDGVYYAHNSYLQIAAESGVFSLYCSV